MLGDPQSFAAHWPPTPRCPLEEAAVALPIQGTAHEPSFDSYQAAIIRNSKVSERGALPGQSPFGTIAINRGRQSAPRKCSALRGGLRPECAVKDPWMDDPQVLRNLTDCSQRSARRMLRSRVGLDDRQAKQDTQDDHQKLLSIQESSPCRVQSNNNVGRMHGRELCRACGRRRAVRRRSGRKLPLVFLPDLQQIDGEQQLPG